MSQKSDIVEAVKRIRFDRQSLRSISKAINILRTTLQRHLGSVNQNIQGAPWTVTAEQLKKFSHALKKMHFLNISLNVPTFITMALAEKMSKN